MNTLHTLAILTTLALAAAPAAPAQESIIVQQIGTNVTITTGGADVSATGSPRRLVVSPDTMFREVEAAARQAMEQAASGAFSVFNGAAPSVLVQSSRSHAHAQPALLCARTLDTAERAEWQEDLRVMDKLLRDEINRIEGDVSRQAMGIRLLVVDRVHAAPTWVDGFGVMFDYEVSFPLASATRQSPTGRGDNTAGSAWERARQSLDNASTTNRPPRPRRSSQAAFEPATVDALLDGLATTLAEAKNMRRLAPDHVVLVTVTGSDDAGKPVRLTLRTTRREIDRLAAGQITPPAFRNALAWSIQ